MMLWPTSAIAGVALFPVVMGILLPQMLLQSPLFLVMYGVGASMFLVCSLIIIQLFCLEKRHKYDCSIQARFTQRETGTDQSKRTTNPKFHISSIPESIVQGIRIGSVVRR